MNADDVLIGIDGGGTNTRVLVCDLKGNVLSYCEKGAASIRKDVLATQNVHAAIAEALKLANKEGRQVIGTAAGIAGFDTESDLEWVAPLTEIPGLSGPKWHVNDAVVAHYGALLAKPGIVVISGTGSIIVAIAEDGRFSRNYDFHHYAASAARFIAYDAVYEILAGQTDQTDEALIQSMLQHWHVQSIAEFSKLARGGFTEDRQERDKIFGQFAPAITQAAEQGSSVAVTVCDRAVNQIKVGIELLAASFAGETVEITFIGSVVNSPYFSKSLRLLLSEGRNKSYTLVEPELPPVAGAVLYAMNRLKLPITQDILHNLQSYRY
ncbi:N-acetylglucosamine kinase [Paenibacillus sp. BC26]|uniref:N-acetylglucosamine kinase n=1 Tax=Paenibacillus sp. BC26 TaxID=1881032 RepID=UPI0008E8935D|nr:BadF/BadG/BcrA/BcrD ATPase family protein [Paenibacillus sp. BC26]SFT08251.1 glucosamine kinase [Paenibacillus sp. BC26]